MNAFHVQKKAATVAEEIIHISRDLCLTIFVDTEITYAHGWRIEIRDKYDLDREISGTKEFKEGDTTYQHQHP